MDQERQERIRYYGFAAFVGILLALNLTNVFKTFLGIDTAVFIAAERNAFDLDGYLASLGDEPIAIAAITASELLHGVERAKAIAVRARRSAYVEGVLANVPILPLTTPLPRNHQQNPANHVVLLCSLSLNIPHHYPSQSPSTMSPAKAKVTKSTSRISPIPKSSL